jgi:GNAT superfamily N-acetyltransferase/uncharacterized low-complexity protein
MKSGVAEVAGGLFERLASAFDVGGDVDLQKVQGDFQAGAEVGDECGIRIRLFAAEVVVDMNCGQDHAQRFALRAVSRVERKQEGDGVCPAGDSGADAVAGAEVFAGEGKCGRGGHRVMLTRRYTASMFEIRLALPEDAELIGQQRRQMFFDAGQPDDKRMAEMFETFVPWVRGKLAEDRYIGWLASEDGVVVGGAGLWLMEFPPHFLQVEPVRGYLLNFYTAPEFRGRGLAKVLLREAVEEARRRGCEVVTLHASKFGRPIYEKNGFRQTNEMMLRFDAKAEDRTRS